MNSEQETITTGPQPAQPAAGTAEDSTAVNPAPKEKVGIGGCLLYPLLFLLVQPIAFVYTLFTRPRPLSVPGQIVTFRIYWPNAVLDIITIVLAVALLVLFLRKKAIVSALFVTVVALLFALWTGYAITAPPPPLGAGDPIRSSMALLVQCFVLIPYFTRSRRVQNTFVRPLDAASPFERLFLRSAGPLTRLYAWLVRSGKWVFLRILGFVAAVIAISAAIDAVLGPAIDAVFMRFR